MTDDEYAFLTDRTWTPDIMDRYYKSGEGCYENGWIDVFGLVTPKGKKALEEFENDVG